VEAAMRTTGWIFGGTLVLGLACTGGDTAPPPAAPACDLALDTLAGKTFIRQIKADKGDGYDPDPLARLRFSQEGDVLKVKYTVRSLASVYTYTCGPDEKDAKQLVCKQDDPDMFEFCRSLYANIGQCAPDQLAAVLGVPAEPVSPQIAAAVAKIEEETKKLKGPELTKYKAGYNSPNVQLRGLLKIKVRSNETECRLSVSDMYENFSDGKRVERENVVGSGARFVEVDKDYVFEDCRNFADLVATADATAKPKPGDSQVEWQANQTATFRYVGAVSSRPEAGCDYSMDTWYDYNPRGTGVPVAADASGALDWSFPVAMSEKGHKVAHMYRYKTCGGKPAERIDVVCQQVKVL
jgi:hypothetical protein